MGTSDAAQGDLECVRSGCTALSARVKAVDARLGSPQSCWGRGKALVGAGTSRRQSVAVLVVLLAGL